jgi:hypothetical protein
MPLKKLHKKMSKTTGAKTLKSARKERAQSAQALAINEQLFRRIFIVVLVAMLVTVMLGLGPVWLSAEATRASQHSQILQGEIADTLGISESLEMQRAAITNELRISQSTLEDLGMVRCEGIFSYVQLDSTGFAASTNFSLTSTPRIGVDSVAYLAALSLDGSGENPAVATQQASESGNTFGQMARNALDTIAHLTAGEASTLLVGDVGLAGMR